MKQILIALAAALSLGSAVAQPRDWHDRDYHRGEPITVPDRVERHITRESGVRHVTIDRYRCVIQRHGECRKWEVIHRERDQVRR